MEYPYFPIYVNDFITGTMGMTTEEVGGYVKLLFVQWDKGGLPDDNAQLMKLAGVKIKSLQSILTKFNKCEDGLLKNNRLETERNKIEAMYDRKRAAGSLGGKKPKNEKKQQVSYRLANGFENDAINKPTANLQGGENQNQNQNQNQIPSDDGSAGATVPPPPPGYDGFKGLEELAQLVVRDEVFVWAIYQLGVMPDKLPGWLEAFNWHLSFTGTKQKQERDYRQHFPRWLARIPNYRTMDPGDYSAAGVEVRASASAGSGGRKVVMRFNGGEVEWTEEQHERYKANSAASGYTFLRYE